ncbi:GNAT family N-acetyltransferase [bacterium]|nr:GNAT family N-acetyltransferase [bacterium]
MPDPGPVIRPYRAPDLEALLQVWDSATGGAYGFLDAAYLERERANIAAQYLPISETWVAELDGRTAGFLCLQGIEVAGLFVAAQFQRRGIGRALLSHALALAGTLELEVFLANPAAIAFYEACGFAPLYQRLHDDSGLPVLRMQSVEAETEPAS